jgi:hypothetical protein
MAASAAWSWQFDRHGISAPALGVTVRRAAEVSASLRLDELDSESLLPDELDVELDVTLDVAAGPFRGTVQTSWFVEDVDQLGTAFAQLSQVALPGPPIVVGGNRATELQLRAEPVEGVDATPDDLVVEARLTGETDEATPALSFHFYTSRTELRDAADTLAGFLRQLEV